MDAQLPNEERGAAVPETLPRVNPVSAEMDATPPAEEIVVDATRQSEASSADAVSTTLNSTESEAARGVAMAVGTQGEDETIQEDNSVFEKDHIVDDKKLEEMAVTKASPQTEGEETQNVEAATSRESMEARLHTPQYENAEITLVVEMNTDAEMTVETGVVGDEIVKGEADTSLKHGALLQVVEQMGTPQCEEELRDTSPAVTHEDAETSATKNIPQEKMGNMQIPDGKIGQNEPADSDMHDVDVDTQNMASDEGFGDGSLPDDEAMGLPKKLFAHADAQIKEDAKAYSGEDGGTFAGELEAKVEGILNEAGGLHDALEGLDNDKAGSRTSEALGGSMEIVVEAGNTEKGCKVMDVETEANSKPCIYEVSADVTDEEREKDGMAEQELAGVEGSNGLAQDVVDITRKEQDSGSNMLQLESGAQSTSLENAVVQAGPLENSRGRHGIGEGIERAEVTVVSTEAMRNEEADKVEEPGPLSSILMGMDANTTVFDKQKVNVHISQHMESDSGEGAEQGMQEMHHGTEVYTPNVAPLQDPLDVGRVSQSGIMENERRPLLETNNESRKGVGTEVLEDHSALHSIKDTVKVVDFKTVDQGSERKEEGAVQDLQGPPAIQGDSKLKNLAFETNFSEGDRRFQWERQQNRQFHTEMQIRLLPDKSVRADLIKSHEVVEGGTGMRMHKELPLANSKEAQDEGSGASAGQHWRLGIVMQVKTKADTPGEERPKDAKMREIGFENNQGWAFQGTAYENAAHGISRGGRAGMFEEEKTGMSDEANTGTSEEEKYLRAGFAKGVIIEKSSQKRKLSDNLASDSGLMNELGQNDNVVKKAKKKAVNVWAKSSSRKGPKKNSKNGVPQNPSNEDSVLLTPVYVNPDKVEDGPDQPIALSKYDKAEKIELSENRLTASSTKGYRMVRATRGVQEGAWYFEIVVEQLGPTGHTRLGWSTQKGDVQAPVGFDSNSYGYRDLDGSKTHVAVREPYGDLYVEGDVIGFYIDLPNGAEYAPKPAPLISYRGRPYLSDIKEELPRRVPGSEICFFRNGVCQGTAFRDINAGRYFPAASMYTLPKEPSCIVRFNFGPDFRFPPVDIGDRTPPQPMAHAPYHNAVSGKEVGTVAWANASITGNASLNNEPQMKIV